MVDAAPPACRVRRGCRKTGVVRPVSGLEQPAEQPVVVAILLGAAVDVHLVRAALEDERGDGGDGQAAEEEDGETGARFEEERENILHGCSFVLIG